MIQPTTRTAERTPRIVDLTTMSIAERTPKVIELTTSTAERTRNAIVQILAAEPKAELEKENLAFLAHGTVICRSSHNHP